MVSTEVIVTTYNNPQALHFALLGLEGQSTQAFKVCVADDGSGSETQEVISIWQQRFGNKRFRHVWHPDNGFAKNEILNKAIATSTADYLIFIDGDCIAHPNFIVTHINSRSKFKFLTGGVIRLPSTATLSINDEIIQSQQIFSQEWLFQIKIKKSLSNLLKFHSPIIKFRQFLNYISPVKRTWNGGNASTWRDFLVKVNGFDESLRYGAEDIELGFRLSNFGIKGRHVRYTALLLHIDHTRDYANSEEALNNKIISKKNLNSNKIRTDNGIIKS